MYNTPNQNSLHIMAKQISHKQRLLLLASAEKLSLDFVKLEAFALKHGIMFTRQILTLATKPPRRKKGQLGTIIPFIIYPKKVYKKLRKEQEHGQAYWELIEAYKEVLKDIGFTLFEWDEDFVDEDTGEIVSLPRCRFDYKK